MRNILLCVGILVFFFTGCQTKNSEVITYELQKKDFVEKIFGTGTLQSANSVAIITPRVSANEIKVNKLIQDGSMVHEGDTLCVLLAPMIEQYYDNFSKELDKAKANLVKEEANNAVQISMLNAKLLEHKAQEVMTQLDSLQIQFSPPVKQKIMKLELEKNQIQQQKIVKKLEAQKKISEQSIRALNSQIIQKEQNLQRFQDQLDLLTIISPKKGMAVHATSPTMIFMGSGGSGSSGGKIKEGATVRPNMALVTLPDLDSMQIELMCQEADFMRIEKGQSVIIHPESNHDITTTGTIKSKSLSSKPLAYKFKVKTYKIIIDIDSLDAQLAPGLSANCEIVLQNIKDTIVTPTISIFEKDSMKIVYVWENESFISHPVTTGTSNSSQTIITEGLNGNETVALVEPPFQLIKKLNKPADE